MASSTASPTATYPSHGGDTFHCGSPYPPKDIAARSVAAPSSLSPEISIRPEPATDPPPGARGGWQTPGPGARPRPGHRARGRRGAGAPRLRGAAAPRPFGPSVAKGSSRPLQGQARRPRATRPRPGDALHALHRGRRLAPAGDRPYLRRRARAVHAAGAPLAAPAPHARHLLPGRPVDPDLRLGRARRAPRALPNRRSHREPRAPRPVWPQRSARPSVEGGGGDPGVRGAVPAPLQAALPVVQPHHIGPDAPAPHADGAVDGGPLRLPQAAASDHRAEGAGRSPAGGDRPPPRRRRDPHRDHRRPPPARARLETTRLPACHHPSPAARRSPAAPSTAYASIRRPSASGEDVPA